MKTNKSTHQRQGCMDDCGQCDLPDSAESAAVGSFPT